MAARVSRAVQAPPPRARARRSALLCEFIPRYRREGRQGRRNTVAYLRIMHAYVFSEAASRAPRRDVLRFRHTAAYSYACARGAQGLCNAMCHARCIRDACGAMAFDRNSTALFDDGCAQHFKATAHGFEFMPTAGRI